MTDFGQSKLVTLPYENSKLSTDAETEQSSPEPHSIGADNVPR